jgi:hypothetical protein
MNKKFLNDVKVLIVFIPGVVFITFCLIASLMSADETAQYIISSFVWGGFDIFIKPNWKWFNHHIFKGTRDEWFTKFEFLTIFRNPVAHNNIIGKEEQRIASDYCNDITTAIREWQKNKYKDDTE